jgi:uncharacterized protein involved in outer membrane biogenesis
VRFESRKRIVLVAGAVGLLAGFVWFLSRDDWNWAKPVARWAVSRATGRELAIEGDLRVDLGFPTDVEVRGVRLANAAWASSPEMLVAERIALRLRPLPLLAGKLRLESLDAEAAHLELESRANGENNWSTGERRASAGPISLPRDVALEEFSLTLTDPARPRGFELRVGELVSSVRGAVRLVGARGVYQEEPFVVQVALLEAAEPVGGRTPALIRAEVGSTRARADGWIGDGSAGRLFELRVKARGESLDDLWRTIGFPLPRSPAFSVAGRLSYGDDTVVFERFSGRLGRSDLSGDLTVHLPRGHRMRIDADVRSRAIDTDDFEGFWGKPPAEEGSRSGGGGVAPPPGAPDSVFPDLEFELAKLRVADARIRFAADRVQGKTVLDHVRLDATLEGGRLDLHPLVLGMSAGELTSRAQIDARRETPLLQGDLVLRGVRLDQLLARSGVGEGAGGELGGRAEIRTRGKSLRELARNSNGEVGAVLQNGWISDPLLELVALHLGGFIRAKLDKEEPGPVRCLVGVFDAADGVLAARTLLLDTSHVRIEGEGKIDLMREEMDIELTQHSKHLTIGALKTPIEITGPLTSRTARLKPGPLLARGGVAAALGAAIHPLVALLALVDPGKDDRPGACQEALAEYRPIAGSVPGAAAPRPGEARERGPR